MKFISTRGKSPAVTAAEAIRRGLAPDGGLYVPDALPVFSASELEALYALPYAELSAAVLERFLPGFSREELLDYTKKAYASFDDDAVVPLHALGDKLWTMELFHGPTCAFKDVALQILPYLLAASVRKCADEHTVAILVATSGDTGKAALEGFADVPGTKIAVFYPDGGVSDIQRAQMATQGGDNVLVLAVRGNFDDAQTGVKDIFADAALAAELDKAGVVLSSANSINWGRLAPQIAYYFAAYAQLLRAEAVAPGERVDFSVPTGNFGDILAGYFAKRAGLPVGKLLCASNSNNVLTDFLRTGVYDKNRPFLRTMSPSMDILVSSNLERLLYLAAQDGERVSEWMQALRGEGKYAVGEELLSLLADEGFAAFFASEEETARVIRTVWDEKGYLADPHTAAGLSAAVQYRCESGETRPTVALSTASPFKFAAAMLSSLGGAVPENDFAALDALSAFAKTPVPAPLDALRAREERFKTVVEKDEMRESVRNWLVK